MTDNDDDNEENELLQAESRRRYKEWVDGGCIPHHPNAFHDPSICPGCFARYEFCVCNLVEKREADKTGRSP